MIYYLITILICELLLANSDSVFKVILLSMHRNYIFNAIYFQFIKFGQSFMHNHEDLLELFVRKMLLFVIPTMFSLVRNSHL